MKWRISFLAAFAIAMAAAHGWSAENSALVMRAKSGDGAALLQLAKNILVYDTDRHEATVSPDSRDARQAYRLIKKAANAKCGEAIFVFGILLENDGQTIRRLQSEGFDLGPVIASSDFREENSMLSNRPIDEGNVRTAEKIVALYRRAAENGYPAAASYAREMEVRVREFRGKMDKRAANSSVVDEILNDDEGVTGTIGKDGEPEVKKVRISSSRLGLSRPKGSSTSFVRGQLRIEYAFAPRRFKRPVVRVLCLCDVDGSVNFYEGFFYTPNRYDRMGGGELQELFKDAGESVTSANMDELMHDAKKISANQKEVDREKFTTVVYGSTSTYAGYFRIPEVVRSAKLLLYRVEVWQNGILANQYESAKTGLGKYEIPDDWHVWHKYPMKYKYVEENF